MTQLPRRDTPPGMSVKAFPKKFKTEQGRAILRVCDSRLDRLEWIGECELRTNVHLSLFCGCRHSVANHVMLPPPCLLCRDGLCPLKTVSQN